jgi:hypothetical protein
MEDTTAMQMTDAQLLECAANLECQMHRMHTRAWAPSRKAVRFLQYLAKDRSVDKTDATLIRIVIDELNRFSQIVGTQMSQRMLEAADALESALPA